MIEIAGLLSVTITCLMTDVFFPLDVCYDS